MSWTEVEIKRVSRVSYGLGQPPKLSVNGIPIIRATNIHRGSITRDNLMYASLEDLPLNRAPLLMAGEILVVRSGAYTGDSALVTEEWEGSAPGYDLRVTPEHVEPRFIAYSLLGAHVQAQIRVANSRAAQPHLNAEEFGSIRITAPSVQEQRRIADFLDAETSRIDSMVTSQRQLRALLLERRVAQVHALVSGVKDSDRKQSKLTWLDTIPKTWASAKINFFARMGSGHTPSRSHPEWWTDCRVPWITTGEVSQIRDDRREIITETREKISKIGLANSAAELHSAETVVLSRTASAGFSAVMGSAMATSQDYVTWTCGPRLNPYYLLWCLRAMREDLLERLAMGSTHKTIYFPDLQGIRIPLPPLHEQRAIVSDIRQANRRVDALVDSIDHQVNLLTERRQALITAAVTGQLDVTTARSGVRP